MQRKSFRGGGKILGTKPRLVLREFSSEPPLSGDNRGNPQALKLLKKAHQVAGGRTFSNPELAGEEMLLALQKLFFQTFFPAGPCGGWGFEMFSGGAWSQCATRELLG